jgi:hypothetical protein
MVNYHILKNSLVVNFNGKTITIHKDDSRYMPVLRAIKNGDLDTIPDLVDVSTQLESKGFKVVDGLVAIDGQKLPELLSSKILEFIKLELPVEPLFKFWDNLKANPSFNSRLMLYAFLEHNGHPITEDGCFIAYRGVSDDFKDLHSGTFDNSVGSICEMPREQVDDNPENTCSSGLHVACYHYANGFGPKLVEVKVNPRDVVCVPKDYNGTKMRVCKFEVVNVAESINNQVLYGSEYHCSLDAEYQDYDYDDFFDDGYNENEEI